MYDMKALYQAKSVQDAINLRLQHPEAQIIAGGSDVLVQMREGKRAGAELISIQMLDEIRGVTLEADGTIRISLGLDNTMEEMDITAAHMAKMAALLGRYRRR